MKPVVNFVTMRLIFSGLFVFIGVLTTVGIIGAFFPDVKSPWILAIAPIGAGAGLIAIAFKFFNTPGARLSGYKSIEDYIEELKKQDLIEPIEFYAKRAFQVEEYEDEGSHYYVELSDSSVLFLSGQYLYEYEPINDDGDNNQIRRFPCKQFTLYRHKKEGFTVGIECKGDVLEPELLARAFNEKDFQEDSFHEDGKIIKGRTYDEIKLERM